MRNLTILLILTLAPIWITAQKLEVEGKVKITDMDTLSTGENVVVREADGTLAEGNLNQAIIGYLTSLPNGIQNVLNLGETPLNFYKAGIPVDSLYGKTFAGGLIFYVDTLDIHPFEGLVAAPMDHNYNGDFTRPWGFVGKDLPNVPNEVTCCIPTGPGSLIGKGQMNTDSIVVNGCITSGDVANICSDLSINSYDDWFLPSILELDEMYTNLHLAGIGDFAGEFYWSSTEYGSSTVWVQNFVSSLKGFGNKSSNGRVRAVRAF